MIKSTVGKDCSATATANRALYLATSTRRGHSLDSSVLRGWEGVLSRSRTDLTKRQEHPGGSKMPPEGCRSTCSLKCHLMREAHASKSAAIRHLHAWKPAVRSLVWQCARTKHRCAPILTNCERRHPLGTRFSGELSVPYLVGL